MRNVLMNWKSTVAFLLFISGYGYSLYAGLGGDIVSTTGSFALLSMIAMMLRSEQLMKLLEKLIDRRNQYD